MPIQQSPKIPMPMMLPPKPSRKVDESSR